MQIIEQKVPEEQDREQYVSSNSSYIPNDINYPIEDVVQKEERSQRWLESQLNSPQDFSDHIKNLIDETWSDEYA